MLSRVCAICVGTVWLVSLAAAGQPSSVWLDVPFVPQEKNACGAASIAMVLQYWAREQHKISGPEADAAAIQRELYSEQARGIFASALEQYLTRHGMQTFAFRGGRQDLEHHLAKGRPLIVALGKSASSQLHFVVVAGIDAGQETVLVNDPARRKLLKEDWRDFERQWGATDHWTLLAVPQ